VTGGVGADRDRALVNLGTFEGAPIGFPIKKCIFIGGLSNTV